MHKIAERNQAAIQRQILDRGYERAKEIVKKDVDRKKITKPQADAITKKLDELYSQHKKDPSKQLTTDERQALNEWAKKQGVSNRYFIYIH